MPSSTSTQVPPPDPAARHRHLLYTFIFSLMLTIIPLTIFVFYVLSLLKKSFGTSGRASNSESDAEDPGEYELENSAPSRNGRYRRIKYQFDSDDEEDEDVRANYMSANDF